MESIIFFFNDNIFLPVCNAVCSLYADVLAPAASSFADWIRNSVPICVDFAGFCTSFFQLKYQVRIYSFMIVFPIIIVIIICSFFGRKRRIKNAQKKIK